MPASCEASFAIWLHIQAYFNPLKMCTDYERQVGTSFA